MFTGPFDEHQQGEMYQLWQACLEIFYFFSCLCLDKPFSYCTKSYKGELQSVTLTSTTTSVPFYQKLRIRISLQLPHVTSGNLASTLSKMWAANKTVVLSFACFCSDGVEDYLPLLGEIGGASLMLGGERIWTAWWMILRHILLCCAIIRPPNLHAIACAIKNFAPHQPYEEDEQGLITYIIFYLNLCCFLTM